MQTCGSVLDYAGQATDEEPGRTSELQLPFKKIGSTISEQAAVLNEQKQTTVPEVAVVDRTTQVEESHTTYIEAFPLSAQKSLRQFGMFDVKACFGFPQASHDRDIFLVISSLMLFFVFSASSICSCQRFPVLVLVNRYLSLCLTLPLFYFY